LFACNIINVIIRKIQTHEENRIQVKALEFESTHIQILIRIVHMSHIMLRG